MIDHNYNSPLGLGKTDKPNKDMDKVGERWGKTAVFEYLRSLEYKTCSRRKYSPVDADNLSEQQTEKTKTHWMIICRK